MNTLSLWILDESGQFTDTMPEVTTSEKAADLARSRFDAFTYADAEQLLLSDWPTEGRPVLLCLDGKDEEGTAICLDARQLTA